MKIYHNIFFCLLFISNLWAAEVKDVKVEGETFWQKNDKIYQKILRERDIIVLVKAHDSKNGGLNRLDMQGIGLVNLDHNRSFRLAQDLNNLSQISDNIKEVRFDKEKMTVFMHSEAFNYEAKMWMNVKFETTKNENSIILNVYKGVFVGMRAKFIFKDYKRRKTEVQFLANYSYDKLPIPQFFIEFGLEVVIQKIAAKMRTFLEEQKSPQKPIVRKGIFD